MLFQFYLFSLCLYDQQYLTVKAIYAKMY